MKFRTSVLIFSVSFFFLFVTSPFAHADKKPINIGLLYDVTGIYSAMGLDTQRTAKMGAELINENGGIRGHLIHYIVSDGQSDPTKAVLAVKRLIENKNIYAIQGCNGTGVALAVGPVCEENKVPFVTNTASEIFENTLKPKWSFRVTWKGWEQVDLGLGMVKALNPKSRKISILYQGGAFGKAMYNMARKYAKKRGLQIIDGEKYDPRGTDFGAQISNLMRGNPDAVIVYCADMAGPLAMKEMRTMGMDKPIISNGALNMKAVRDAFKDTFSIPPYVYSTGTKPDCWWQLPKESADYKILEPFARKYEETFGDRYNGIAALAINALLIIKKGVENALDKDPNLFDKDSQTIRSAIRDGIEAIHDYNTGDGIFTMSPKDHCGIYPGSAFAPIHWENGKVVYDAELANITPSH